jgi:hypothetical protein
VQDTLSAYQFDIVVDRWESQEAAAAAKMFLSAFLDDLDGDQSTELFHTLFDTELSEKIREREDVPPRVYELYKSAVTYACKFGDLYGMPENPGGNLAYIKPVLH